MPFEWLTHKEKKENSVLVIWINDSVFQDHSLLNLARLFKYLKDSNKPKQNQIKFKIIGPADSTTLEKMVKEVFENSKQLESLRCTKIYSAMATIDNTSLLNNGCDRTWEIIRERFNNHGIEFERTIGTDGGLARVLIKELKLRQVDILESLLCTEIYPGVATIDNRSLLRNNKDNESWKRIKERFDKHGIEFERTIGTDGELARALIKELKLRQVDIKDTKTHLVLIAEGDTNYGRSSFVRAVEEEKIAQQVHRISYLRGIDGSLPGEKEGKQKEDQKDEKAGAKSDPLTDVKKLEQPVGKSQYDYLRRLAEETYNLDQELKVKGKEEIKAIGVMGTDFYDKYLVLQALRQRFPDAIFFTTDLDARMVHPDNIKWTRNLVVASNFGLSLRKDHDVDIQGEVPPFRDNYQTSVFLAVLHAFAEECYLNSTDKDRDQKVKKLIDESIKNPQPLIFEIGRYNSILLTQLPEDTIHPQKYYYLSYYLTFKKIGIISTFFFIILFLTSSRVNQFVKQSILSRKKFTIILILIILIVIYFVKTIFRISILPDEEPFSLFEGISAWPSEIIRFVTILLTALFIYWSWRDRKKNKDDIEKFNFNKKANPFELWTYAEVAKWLKNVVQPDFWRNVVQIKWQPEECEREVSLESLWNGYVRRDSDQYHIFRVIILFICHFFLSYFIIAFDKPVTPARGPDSFRIDGYMLYPSVILFIVLTFYVFDVTRCCRQFIDVASEKLSGKEFNPSLKGIQKQIENQWALVRLIAVRTETIGKFIFYPFIVLLVMFVARFDYFDNWRTPAGLAVVIFLVAFYAWICAFLLRQSAERARASVVERLNVLLYFSHKIQSQDTIKQIEFVINEVRSIRQGAFASFTQHPVLQSLLVPSSGIGGIYLIQFITKMT